MYTTLVILREGDVPVINVLNRKWNDDSIAAIIDLKLSEQVNKVIVSYDKISSIF